MRQEKQGARFKVQDGRKRFFFNLRLSDFSLSASVFHIRMCTIVWKVQVENTPLSGRALHCNAAPVADILTYLIDGTSIQRRKMIRDLGLEEAGPRLKI
jgi:hypothetical protein